MRRGQGSLRALRLFPQLLDGFLVFRAVMPLQEVLNMNDWKRQKNDLNPGARQYRLLLVQLENVIDYPSVEIFSTQMCVAAGGSVRA